MLSLKVNGRRALIVPMPTFWVVEHFDIVENISPDFFAVGVETPLDALALERLEGAFGYRQYGDGALTLHACADVTKSIGLYL